MRVVTAQLAGGERNADRVMVTDNAVLVLDGATAFEPVDLDPGEYAESIGRGILSRLANSSIETAVASAIAETTQKHSLIAGRSPSSTVSVVRARGSTVELYVLGDSPIYYGTESKVRVLRDDRINGIGVAEREQYIAQLMNGRGYTDSHRLSLSALQQEQQRWRNCDNGYWICEAAPEAALHGFARTLPASEVSWAVLCTDGASDLLEFQQNTDWHDLAGGDEKHLDRLLRRLQEWERDVDPHGVALPRAKRHDDKTIAAVKL